jgi:hypothetical protein
MWFWFIDEKPLRVSYEVEGFVGFAVGLIVV